MSLKEELWDFVAENQSEYAFFIEKGGEAAEKPAVFIMGYSKRGHGVYINQVGLVGLYTLTEALKRVGKLVDTANYPLKLWIRKGANGRLRLFGENKTTRIRAKPCCPLRAFNVPEWNGLATVIGENANGKTGRNRS